MSDKDTIAELRRELAALERKYRHDLTLMVDRVSSMNAETNTRLDDRVDTLGRNLDTVRVDVEDLKERVPRDAAELPEPAARP